VRLVWPNPPPVPQPTGYQWAQWTRMFKEVDGEYDDILKYLRLWDGSDAAGE
jgi:hypothetical protein